MLIKLFIYYVKKTKAQPTKLLAINISHVIINSLIGTLKNKYKLMSRSRI